MQPIRMKLLHDKVYRAAEEMSGGIYRQIAPLEAKFALTEEPVPFSQRQTLRYKTIRCGEIWSNTLWDCAWFHITGEVPQGYSVNELFLGLDVDGEGCLFDKKGTPIRGITNVSSEFDPALAFQGKRFIPFADKTFNTKRIDLWLDAANNDLFGRLKSGKVCMLGIYVCNTALRDLFYDYKFLISLAEGMDERSPLRMGIFYALEKVAVNVSAQSSSEKIASLRAVLKPYLDRKGPAEHELTFYATGHSHLDLAWLWPIRETKRKAARTFSTALANIKLYPDYIYGASQPQQFAWVKEEYPTLFEKLKTAVAEGRMEVQGGMWVEPDTNVTGGESLIRQFYYGKRFWKEEFGKDVDTLWLPDVFGFSGALPQIIRGCGCKNMLTIKLSWNMVNTFPYHSFRWKGIDGSEVLVHMPPEGKYDSSASPKKIYEAAGNYSERGISKVAMMLYGVCDGGGGPGREYLEFVKREKDVCGLPRVKNATSVEFFEELNKERELLPEYCGEMYLERHQGTYTSQAENKRYNRAAETALAEAEYANVLHGDASCYAEWMDEVWKEILLYQFHDILPGSSIRRVYNETKPRYEALLAAIHAHTEKLLKRENGRLCALNIAPYPRTEYVREGENWYKVSAGPWSIAELKQADGTGTCRAEGLCIENTKIRAEFDESGALVGLYDKANGRTAMRRGNLFRLYEDSFDAWDTYAGYIHSDAEIPAAHSTEYFNNGFEAGIVFTYSFGKSALRQVVRVKENDAALYFDNHVDWNETKKMLRVDFYPAVFAEEATFDIQFGNLKRSMKENNSHEWAQFEVCAHKWVDVSEPDYGVALLNDCKYGYRAKNGLISMDILRSQMYPCEEQDKGEHDFAFALLPHSGNVYTGEVMRAAYCMNRPLRILEGEPAESLITSSNVHAVIETVKPAFDGKGLVARIYNDLPEDLVATVSCGTREGYISDMLETQTGEKITDALHFAPYEIKTVRFI